MNGLERKQEKRGQTAIMKGEGLVRKKGEKKVGVGGGEKTGGGEGGL